MSQSEFWQRLRQSAAMAAAVAIGVAGGLLLVWYAGELFLVAFAGALFAVLLQTVASWLSGCCRLPYGCSLAVVVVALVTLLALAGWLIGAQVAEQLQALGQTLPQAVQQLQAYVTGLPWGQWLTSGISQLGTIVFSAVWFATYVIVILFIGLYGAADPDLYRRGLLEVVPPERRERAAQILDRVVHTIRWWLLGQLASMIVVGLLTGLGLSLLGIRLALVLGLLAFLLEIIPNLGPILAAIPALLVASTQGTTELLYVALLYLAVQSLESYVIMPLIQRKAVRLPPAILIFAVVLLGFLGGVVGALVAAPLTAVILVLVKNLYVEGALEETANREETVERERRAAGVN